MIGKRKSFKRAIPAFGLVLVASLALGAIGVASASAATQHWYVGGTKLAEGTKTNVTLKGTTNFYFAWTNGSSTWEAKCTSQTGESTIENPTGGKAGTYAASGTSLSGCTRVRPAGVKGCQIPGGTIYLGAYGADTEFESKSAVEFLPVGGSFADFWLDECPGGVGHIIISGSFTGIANNATSSLEFTKASSSLIVFAHPATLVGTSKLETTGGQTVTVAP